MQNLGRLVSAFLWTCISIVSSGCRLCSEQTVVDLEHCIVTLRQENTKLKRDLTTEEDCTKQLRAELGSIQATHRAVVDDLYSSLSASRRREDARRRGEDYFCNQVRLMQHDIESLKAENQNLQSKIVAIRKGNGDSLLPTAPSINDKLPSNTLLIDPALRTTHTEDPSDFTPHIRQLSVPAAPDRPASQLRGAEIPTSRLPRNLFSISALSQESIFQRSSLPVSSLNTAQSSNPANNMMLYPPRAENGDIFGRDNDGDGRIETVHVRGYFKKNGTYVRSHYRAAPHR